MGKKPNPVDQLTQDDFDNVDCLICHAPNYARTVVMENGAPKIAPAAGVNVLAAAQSAQKPTNDMCLRCHLSTGGGPNAKHGDIGTPGSGDVHQAKGVACVDCHPTQKHKFAGAADLKLHELPDVVVDCTNCHTGAIHTGEYAAVNAHLDRVACQTCHIPAIARDPKYPTHLSRDWTKSKLLPTGLYGPTNVAQNNVTPVYLWWNGKVTTPPGPLGDIDDPDAKITPWKAWLITAPRDAVSKEPIPLKAGTYAITGDIEKAILKGVQDSGMTYSGQWEAFEEEVFMSNNHQVSPAESALHCQDCHSPEGRLNFAELGYPAEAAQRLQNGYIYSLRLPMLMR